MKKICVFHREYKAINKPKTNCLRCWEIWADKHPKEIITAKEAMVLFKCVRQLKENKNPTYVDDLL